MFFNNLFSGKYNSIAIIYASISTLLLSLTIKAIVIGIIIKKQAL